MKEETDQKREKLSRIPTRARILYYDIVAYIKTGRRYDASDAYITARYNVNRQTIWRMLRTLKEEGLIEITHEQNEFMNYKRIVSLTDSLEKIPPRDEENRSTEEKTCTEIRTKENKLCTEIGTQIKNELCTENGAKPKQTRTENGTEVKLEQCTENGTDIKTDVCTENSTNGQNDVSTEKGTEEVAANDEKCRQDVESLLLATKMLRRCNKNVTPDVTKMLRRCNKNVTVGVSTFINNINTKSNTNSNTKISNTNNRDKDKKEKEKREIPLSGESPGQGARAGRAGAPSLSTKNSSLPDEKSILPYLVDDSGQSIVLPNPYKTSEDGYHE